MTAKNTVAYWHGGFGVHKTNMLVLTGKKVGNAARNMK